MKKQSAFRRKPLRTYTLSDGKVVTGAYFRRLARECESADGRRKIDPIVDELVDRLLAEGRLDPVTMRLIEPPSKDRAS